MQWCTPEPLFTACRSHLAQVLLLTFGIDADEAPFLAEPSPVRKWMEGKYAFKAKEDLNCNAIDAKYLSVDGRYVARNGPGPRFVVVARK